jgi:hypothetical protein
MCVTLLCFNAQVIVSGIPQSVRLAVAMIEDVFTFGKAADEQHHHAAAVAAAAAAAAHHFPLQVLATHYCDIMMPLLATVSKHSCTERQCRCTLS